MDFPCVYFHGTAKLFDVFAPGHDNGWSHPRDGFYFTDDLSIAKEFGSIIKRVHLLMRCPLDLRDPHAAKADFAKVVAALPDGPRGNILSLDYHSTVYGAVVRGMTQTTEFTRALRVVGFDSLVIPDRLGGGPYFDSFVVFDISQIEICRSTAA